MKKVDVFISHASEDKVEVARPLATMLMQAGLSVWLDEYEISLGDSLRRKIDRGLATARQGVVILSKAFFAKEWTQKELDALIAREDGSATVILPVWHNVNAKEIALHSPILADRLGVRTDQGLHVVVASIHSAVRKRAFMDSGADAEVALGGDEGAGPKRVDQLMVDFLDRVSGIHEQTQPVPGLRTGFHDLDRLIGGLKRGELYVLASRPCLGRTSLALSAAHHVVSVEGVPALYFAPNSSGIEVSNHLIAATGRLDRWRLAAGRLSNEEWERLADSVEDVASTPLYIDDAPELTGDDIAKRSQQVLDRAGALSLVVIDTLEELVTGPGLIRTGGEHIRSLRLLARKLGCPLLVVCAVNRSSELRTDKRPQLSDLPYSAEIEQNAAAVMFLHSEDGYASRSAEAGSVDVIVARNRGGVLGTIRLVFMRASGRMENVIYVKE